MNINSSLVFWNLLLTFFLLPNNISSQSFLEAIEINSSEPNGAALISIHENDLIISGLYYNDSASRWAGYYASYNHNGTRELLLVEQLDSVVHMYRNGILLFSDNGFQALGDFQDSLYFFNYNPNESKVYSDRFLNKSDEDFVGGSALLKDNEIIICGRNYLQDSIDRDVKILSVGNENIEKYSELDSLSRNVALSLGINSQDEIVVSCLHNDEINDIQSYLIFLNRDLTKIRSTKDFNSVSPMRPNRGFLIDTNDNIIISGEQRETVVGGLPNSFPCISKFDVDGNHLWTKRIGKNVNNVLSYGKWNAIIESIDGQGYILAGSTAYQNLDTLIAKATIAKININGDEIWHQEYTYDTSSHRIVEEFSDIIALENGYAACGSSSNFVADEGRPWLKSVIIKVDENGMLDTTTSNSNIVHDQYDISIFPNPTSDFIHILSSKSFLKINLISPEGKIVKSISQCKSENSIRIRVNHLEPGTYFVEFISNNHNRILKKIVIKDHF